MAGPPKQRADGEPDGRGHADASRATRFTPGDDRPRPGRRKGSKSLKTIYLAIAATPVVLDRNGRKKKISTTEGIVMKQREKALKGDQRASERFLDRIVEYSPPEVQLDLTQALLAEDAQLLADARRRGVIPSIDPVDTAVPDAMDPRPVPSSGAGPGEEQ